MELILLIILIVYLYITNNSINTKFKELHKTIKNLNETINTLQTKETYQKNEVKEQVKQVIKPILKEPKEVSIPEKKKIEVVKPVIKKEDIVTSVQEKNELFQKPTREPVKPIVKKSWFKRFKEKNPDLEKFIGENLINKIGILILVLGISFFVKYAINKNWINEPGRVGIGILCGSILMVIAHKLKKKYVAFSAVLVAGAVSIFYFTIYIAFNEYHLFNQTTAFIILSIITVFSVLVSVSYNRQELAILSLIGGFSAPFMVSTGNGNYVILFTYIAILNIGILAISYFKKWKIVTILAFVFTILLYGFWLGTKTSEDTIPYINALLFATIFYFIFSVTIVLNNLKNKGVFSTIEYFILMANTFFFFGAGMNIIHHWNINFKGIFTLLLAIYNLIYASILYKKFGLDKNAIYLLIGLALTFVTLTVPIQFKGNLITVFWAGEAVLLFWLAKKSNINSFKLGAIIVQILTIFSLLLDWAKYGFIKDIPVIINSLFVSGFVVSVSLFLVYWLVKNEKSISTKFFTLNASVYKITVLCVAIMVTYFTGILEINYQANQFLKNQASALSFPVTYHYIFVALVLFLAILYKNKTAVKVILTVSVLSVLAYIAVFYKLPNNEIFINYTQNTTTKYAFYLHYLVFICLVYFGYQLFQEREIVHNNFTVKQRKWLPWLFVFAIVYVLSNEVMVHGLHFIKNVTAEKMTSNFLSQTDNYSDFSKNLFVKTQINKTKTQIIKIGYPIIWGIFSFVFLIVGIKKQWKTLRIIALSLLGITVLKLFLYDIKNVSETGKIIAFILLGVLVLIISFVYQKIKKLVVDESSED